MKRQGNKSQQTNARHLITIQYRIMVSDNEGGFTENWYERKNVWAEICPIMAKQVFEYASINVHATHRIKILGNLNFQTNTKYENDTWQLIWSGILGTNIQIHYQIDSGSWIEIEASTLNDGLYDWVIPTAAIGRHVIVRVMHLTDTTSYVLTEPYNIVSDDAVDGLPSEHDRIKWEVSNNSRIFEILTVENLQERNIQAVITCKEQRD